MPPPELLGPLGLTIALGVAVMALWRDHLRADADDRTQRDTAIAGWRAQTDATDRLAAAIEAKAEREATRKRQDDR